MRLVVLMATLVGCGTGTPTMGAGTETPATGDPSTNPTIPSDMAQLEMGAGLYSNRLDDGNTFACATCHALTEPAADGITRPGHPIGDAYARGSWKNGTVTTLREAVNSCQDEWMNSEPWTEDSVEWAAINAFLASVSPETSEPISFDIVETEVLDGGDVDNGAAIFTETCIACHANDGTSTQLAPNILGFPLEPDYIARRVRTSGRTNGIYEGLTGGVMPFWSADRLSDDDVRDLIAYINSTEMEPPTPPATPEPGAGPEAPACPTADHPDVGRTGMLTEFFHDVAGTFTVIDDCSIQIDDFFFDGEGIDVRIYGANGGDYENGISMSPNDLRRPTPYAGETIFATLPAGRTWDDVDGISVWCVPIGIDFGSGALAP